MLRKALLNSVFLGVLLAGSQADAATLDPLTAQNAPVVQFYGGINPFYGGINPFYGGINPFWGGINPFYGNINPLYGGINPFYGGINPFWGGINPFYGGINPFWGGNNPFYGGINPFYGNISPFWGDTSLFWGKADPFSGNNDPFYGSTDAFWGNLDPYRGVNATMWATIAPYWKNAGPQWGDINYKWAMLRAWNANDYSGLQHDLNAFIANTQSVWGAAVQKATQKTFMDGYANPLLAKFGIDPNDPHSLANTDAYTRSAFFMAWYDGLMSYSGAPRVDWWMAAAHWSPELAQIANTSSLVTVGVLDAYFTHTNNNVQGLAFVGGYRTYVNDHGAAVGSLIAAVPKPGLAMGVAPGSQVLVYNPFDSTGTASWADVAAGINALYTRGASVINASLGVPGEVLSDEWATILTSVPATKQGVVFVKAAGNDGITQATNINWIGNSAPNNLILVGSIGTDGVISQFSNRPGNACILVNGLCQEQNKLMYRFVVAPGENILVSDNNGGTTRMTGTSFAAPLVAGAVALLQDRWPWLKSYPAETAQIIFRSARDLGAPGVDPIYGWGALDIQASQSPLDFDNLVVYQPGVNPLTSSGATWSTASLKASLWYPGQLSLWQQTSAYIVAFENIGSTYRDFEIPLSSLLTGKSINVGGGLKQFQSYLYQRLIDWAHTPYGMGFDSRSQVVQGDDWTLSITSTPASREQLRSKGRSTYQDIVVFNRSSGLRLRVGEGEGAHALIEEDGFSLRSDFDPLTGGVNPVLGLASGGAYGSVQMQFGGVKVSAGFTQKTDDHTIIDPIYGPSRVEALSPNHASASVVKLTYSPVPALKLSASYTNLREDAGWLGSQGAGLFDMVGGSHTGATTLGVTLSLADGWKILGSATLAQSAAPQFNNSALSFTSPKLSSTSYELVAVKSRLFADGDQMRLTIAQPLHVEGGAISYSSMQIVDRSTGAMGLVNETWSVSGKREYRFEALYSLPVLEGTGTVDFYGLADVNPHTSTSGAPEVAIGTQLRFSL